MGTMDEEKAKGDKIQENNKNAKCKDDLSSDSMHIEKDTSNDHSNAEEDAELSENLTKPKKLKNMYLVKWNGLGYLESTWEYETDLEYFCEEYKEKLQEYLTRKNPRRFDI